MVIGIFSLVCFIGLMSFFWRLSGEKKFFTKLCVTGGLSLVLTVLCAFGAAKELASLKFLFS
ncbi:hypothetical protein D3C81_1942980 [compost metagenome]